MFKELPRGFEKMGLVLHFKKSVTEQIKNQVLKMITRDFYILYSEKKLFADKKEKNPCMTLSFYCKPSDREQIAYRIGLYTQCLINIHSKEDIIHSSHVVHDNFPTCILYKPNNTKNEKPKSSRNSY